MHGCIYLISLILLTGQKSLHFENTGLTRPFSNSLGFPIRTCFSSPFLSAIMIKDLFHKFMINSSSFRHVELPSHGFPQFKPWHLLQDKANISVLSAQVGFAGLLVILRYYSFGFWKGDFLLNNRFKFGPNSGVSAPIWEILDRYWPCFICEIE